MASPRVPGQDTQLTLPCGEEIAVQRLDMGLREFECECGDTHAVVTDVHPPTRFLPEFLIESLEEVIETADDFDSFGTPHLLGQVLEEFPEQVAVGDVSNDGDIGYAIVWVTAFDARQLHEVIVDLVLELMDHAMSHSDDNEASTTFEANLQEFDVETFVEQYREQRNVETDETAPY